MSARTETPVVMNQPPALDVAEAEELAATFKSLADLTRVQIMSLLLAAGKSGLCVCDIVANFQLGQPTISHHLRLLKNAGLVSARKKGLWVFYAVNKERLAHLRISLPVSQQTVRRSECSAE